MFTEAQNWAVVITQLDSVFFQNFDYDATFPSIATANTAAVFKPMQTTHAAYIEQIFKGSGLFPVIGETSTVPQSTPHVANQLTTYIKDFAQGIEISKNLFDDNMHGVWAKAVADFAMVARVSQDQNAFAFFNGAFTTSLTADGSAFISSHTLLSGATQSNQLTVAISATATTALDPTTLYAAIVMLRQQKNQAGVILGNVPSVLLVPSKLYKHAIEITDSALIADSANNNINVYRSAYGITIYTSPYMDSVAGGSDTAWFLLSRNHAVTRLIRQGIQTALRDWSVSNNRTYFYQANFREAVYAPDYVGAVGALGDNT
jgi:phage major head subunit gpT-like protein